MIGKLTRGFLTGQSWRALKSRYTGGDQEQGFRRYFVDGLNQKLIVVCGPGQIRDIVNKRSWVNRLG